MLLFDGGFGVVMLGVWIFCIIDVITTPADRVRNLPKMLWLPVVLFLPDVGSIVWLIAGRDWSGTARTPRPVAATARPTNPDDDQEFLDGLRRRADEQRRRAREADDET